MRAWHAVSGRVFCHDGFGLCPICDGFLEVFHGDIVIATSGHVNLDAGRVGEITHNKGCHAVFLPFLKDYPIRR
jgi:hypothetical protein